MEAGWSGRLADYGYIMGCCNLLSVLKEIDISLSLDSNVHKTHNGRQRLELNKVSLEFKINGVEGGV